MVKLSSVSGSDFARGGTLQQDELNLEISSIILELGLELAGNSELGAPLRRLLKSINCEYVRIVRYRPGLSSNSGETIAGIESGEIRWLRVPNKFEIANPVVPGLFGQCEKASYRTISQLDFDDRPDDASPWQRLSIRYGFKDVWTIVLDQSNSTVDTVEIFTRLPLEDRRRAFARSLGLLAKGLSDAWSRRPPGVVERMLSASRETAPARLPLLSFDNPLGLTRSEFRICERFIRGHSIKRIAVSLEVSPHTVRSHLRNIYSKTGTNSQRELLFLLLCNRPAGEGGATESEARWA